MIRSKHSHEDLARSLAIKRAHEWIRCVASVTAELPHEQLLLCVALFVGYPPTQIRLNRAMKAQFQTLAADLKRILEDADWLRTLRKLAHKDRSRVRASLKRCKVVLLRINECVADPEFAHVAQTWTPDELKTVTESATRAYNALPRYTAHQLRRVNDVDARIKAQIQAVTKVTADPASLYHPLCQTMTSVLTRAEELFRARPAGTNQSDHSNA